MTSPVVLPTKSLSGGMLEFIVARGEGLDAYGQSRFFQDRLLNGGLDAGQFLRLQSKYGISVIFEDGRWRGIIGKDGVFFENADPVIAGLRALAFHHYGRSVTVDDRIIEQSRRFSY